MIIAYCAMWVNPSPYVAYVVFCVGRSILQQNPALVRLCVRTPLPGSPKNGKILFKSASVNARIRGGPTRIPKRYLYEEKIAMLTFAETFQDFSPASPIFPAETSPIGSMHF